MTTFTAKSETVQRDWYLVDAAGKTLGRLSTELARRLRGKHKPVYTPHVDTGDYLVVINAEKIVVTGNKLKDKKYHRFTGYIGNLKTESLEQALERHPERVIEIAVKGMLPKGPWAAPCTASSRSIRVPSIRTPPSSRKFWISNHGYHAKLRHWPPQVLHRSRVPAQGYRQHHRQRPSAGRVLWP